MARMADIKKRSRLALHKAMAASAFHTPVGGGARRPVSVRWHNRMSPALSIEQGGAGIIEGIEKLIFNATELASPTDLGAPIVLARGDLIEIPTYDAGATMFIELDNEGETDGPENVYWSITRFTGA